MNAIGYGDNYEKIMFFGNGFDNEPSGVVVDARFCARQR